MMGILIPLLVACGTLVSLFLFYSLLTSGSVVSGKRLSRVGSGLNIRPLGKTNEETLSLRRSTTDSSIPFLDAFIKSVLPNPDKLRHRLARTGKRITPGAYLMTSAALVVVAFFVFRVIMGWELPMALSLGIVVGLYIPHSAVNRMGNKRIQAFLGGFPEAIDTICRGLRSGLPITECISTIGAESADPIGVEFRQVSDAVRMGRSIEEAMWDVAPRLDCPEFRFFVIALAIQRETGGNLAETLGNLGNLLRKRRQLRLKIRAMSSEAKASAMIIGSLPFLMFLLLYVVSSDYIMILLNTPKGRFLMGGGLTWLSMGVLVMRQMINFEL